MRAKWAGFGGVVRFDLIRFRDNFPFRTEHVSQSIPFGDNDSSRKCSEFVSKSEVFLLVSVDMVSVPSVCCGQPLHDLQSGLVLKTFYLTQTEPTLDCPRRAVRET